MRRVALLAGCFGAVVALAVEGEPADEPAEPSAPLSTEFPLVPWAGPGVPEEEWGPVAGPTEGSWPELARQPILVTTGRRPPAWLRWAVREVEPRFVTPGAPQPDRTGIIEPPEPEITARKIPEPPDVRPVRRNEIIVWGERLQAAEEATAQKLDTMGYEPTRRGDGYTVWAPSDRADRWKPRITIYDDGWYTLKTSLISGGTPQIVGAPGMPAHGGSNAPSFDRAPATPGAGLGFAFSTRRQRKAAEARVARQIDPFVRAIREARSDGELLARLDSLPGELDEIWYGGRSPDGRFLPTVEERKRVLLNLWASRASTREGETVRQAVADYLIGEVDPESPLLAGMVLEAERACACEFPWPWRVRARLEREERERAEARAATGDSADDDDGPGAGDDATDGRDPR